MASERLCFLRVVDRVHDGAAHRGPYPQMALAAGLAPPDVLVRLVADDADGGPALGPDPAALPAGEPQGHQITLAGGQLGARPCAAGQLRPAARLKLDGVNDGPYRNPVQRQRVSDVHLGVGPALHDGADREVTGGEDVALLAVVVVKKRDVGRAVRVVLDRRDSRRHPILAPLEVYETVAPLVPPADVAGGYAAVVVAPPSLVQLGGELLLWTVLRDRVARQNRGIPAARAGRPVTSRRHSLDPLEQLYTFALGQLDDGLLPGRRAAPGEALALGLALYIDRVHFLDAHVERALHGPLYLVLVRPPVHVEGVLPLGLDEVVALLGDDGSDYYLMRVHLSLLSGEPGVGGPREDYLPRPQELVDPVLVGPYHRHPRQVPERERSVLVALGKDEQHWPLQLHFRQKLLGLLRRRRAEGERVEHVEFAVLRLGRERPVECGAGLFAVNALSVTRWLGLRAAPGAAALADR